MKRKSLKKLSICILCLFLIGALISVSGCSSGEEDVPAEVTDPDTAGSDEPKELIVAMGTDASTFDPHFTTDSATEVLNKNIYNNLVRFDADMNLVNDLATDYKVAEDGVTWTFWLREGVEFHDGTPFNAEAVKVNFERVLDENTGSPRRSVLAMIESVEVVDENVVKIVTSYPTGSLLQQLAHPVGAMISPTAIEEYGEDLARNPVGTGPFKLVQWDSGEKIVMEANPNYFEGASKVSRIEFRIVPEDATRAMLIETGDVDVALRLPIVELERLREMEGLNQIETSTVMTMYVALNNQKGALQDVRVRQAMNYAINKETIINDILGGYAIEADAPISPSTWGHASIGAYPYDPDKARQLLADAGYAEGEVEVELWTPVGRYLMDTQIAENLQAQLAEVGINMGIRQWEFQALMEEVKKGEFDMVLLGWSPSTGDADQGLFPVFHSKEWPPASNRAHYANAKVDRLLGEDKMEVDPENRLELYRQAQEIIMDEAAWIFLHYPKQVVVTQSNVTGLEVLPTEHILFAHVDK